MSRSLAIAVAALAIAACGGSGGGSSTSTGGATASTTSGDNGGNGGDNGGNNGGDSGGTTGAPQCQSGADCDNVACTCNDGEVVNYTGCNNGVCATGAAACDAACSDDGGWAGGGGDTGGNTGGGTTGSSAPGLGQPCVSPSFTCATGLICVVHGQSDDQGLCRRACDSSDTFSCNDFESQDGESYDCCPLGNGTGACLAFGSC